MHAVQALPWVNFLGSNARRQFERRPRGPRNSGPRAAIRRFNHLI